MLDEISAIILSAWNTTEASDLCEHVHVDIHFAYSILYGRYTMLNDIQT
jgi:hypothetical protein